ncbi:MAG TPA: hypothetical protein VEZ43_03955 [Dongiaceae bacterium]|nr:hypothetical protein [Dongiaceae bacterium]
MVSREDGTLGIGINFIAKLLSALGKILGSRILMPRTKRQPVNPEWVGSWRTKF